MGRSEKLNARSQRREKMEEQHQKEMSRKKEGKERVSEEHGERRTAGAKSRERNLFSEIGAIPLKVQHTQLFQGHHRLSH